MKSGNEKGTGLNSKSMSCVPFFFPFPAMSCVPFFFPANVPMPAEENIRILKMTFLLTNFLFLIAPLICAYFFCSSYSFEVRSKGTGQE